MAMKPSMKGPTSTPAARRFLMMNAQSMKREACPRILGGAPAIPGRPRPEENHQPIRTANLLRLRTLTTVL